MRIASVPDYTDSRQWNKFPSQKSAAIALTAGQRYYVEALQKDGEVETTLRWGGPNPSEATTAPSEVIPVRCSRLSVGAGNRWSGDQCPRQWDDYH